MTAKPDAAKSLCIAQAGSRDQLPAFGCGRLCERICMKFASNQICKD